MASLFSLIRETIANYNNDNVASWSAALSYYTAFSLTPLLVLTISIVGVLVGEGTAKQEALIQVQKTMGKDAAELASRLLDNASDPGEGLISTVVGMGLLVMGASRIFTQLETSLNTIWKIRTKKKCLIGITDS